MKVLCIHYDRCYIRDCFHRQLHEKLMILPVGRWCTQPHICEKAPIYCRCCEEEEVKTEKREAVLTPA